MLQELKFREDPPELKAEMEANRAAAENDVATGLDPGLRAGKIEA